MNVLRKAAGSNTNVFGCGETKLTGDGISQSIPVYARWAKINDFKRKSNTQLRWTKIQNTWNKLLANQYVDIFIIYNFIMNNNTWKKGNN